MNKKIKTAVTHNSRFHADDIFACAALRLIYPDLKVTRSRDEDDINGADIVFDVGGIYNPEALRFDHHQTEGAGERENKIPYASFGLIWKHFGAALVSGEEVQNRIDQKLIQFIDLIDAKIDGVDLAGPKSDLIKPYFIQFALGSFNPTWTEDENLADVRFFEAVAIAKKILEREIKITEDEVKGEKFVIEAYNNLVDKRILVLDGNYPWGGLVSKWPEVMFVVRPNVQNKNWKVETVRKEQFSYASRKPLPKSWAGLSGEELASVTGVKDATFCHRSYFMAVAKTKEGAIALANKALDA